MLSESQGLVALLEACAWLQSVKPSVSEALCNTDLLRLNLQCFCICYGRLETTSCPRMLLSPLNDCLLASVTSKETVLNLHALQSKHLFGYQLSMAGTGTPGSDYKVMSHCLTWANLLMRQYWSLPPPAGTMTCNRCVDW